MGRTRQAHVELVGNAAQAYQRSVDAFDDAAAQQLGLNRTDLRCLDWLFDGPMSAGELAAATGLSSAATTTLVDRLEAKGFVRRVGDSADRRRVLVELTVNGRDLAGAIYGPLVADGAILLGGFTDQELEVVTRYLETSRELTDRHRERVAGTGT